VAGRAFDFAAGEILVTEYSHKYTLDGFRALAEASGFSVARIWTDPEALFSVQLLEAQGPG
jgi:L-histidine Nalpha-methyltransferase